MTVPTFSKLVEILIARLFELHKAAVSKLAHPVTDSLIREVNVRANLGSSDEFFVV
jgi:hypothetical protein